MNDDDLSIFENKSGKKYSGATSGAWEIVKFALLALLIVVPIRAVVAQPFIVSGSSMVPTFEDGQYLIVDELSYHLHDPARGDVVIFKYPKDPSKYFIKRVIGLPGDTVIIEDGKVTIKNTEHPAGEVLVEPYINNVTTTTERTTLQTGEYFVMGDNRGASSDSRTWGTVQRKLFVGRAFLRLFPIAEASVLPGEHKL